MICTVRSLSRSLVCAAALVAVVALTVPRESPAQGLGIALFERYLDALRQEVGIPGLSAAIVQNGAVIWQTGLGFADVERSVRPRADTPYPIGDLSQVLAATVVLQCMEEGALVIDDRMERWTNVLPESAASVLEVLAHSSDASRDRAYHYDPARFSSLTAIAEWCRRRPYAVTIARDVFDRLGMVDSVPGDALPADDKDAAAALGAAHLARYASVLARVARPYQGSRRSAPRPASYEPQMLDASTGAVSTVLDLARFDAALDAHVLVNDNTLAAAWRQVTIDRELRPRGLGWFVQTANGRRLVWHFGEIPGAYSSLMLKVPERQLTLILLANSDGLSAPFSLEDGDVTRSLFATLFLRLMA
jgi:CubicO group peptidase (beta-lactamase class C family)